MSGQDLLLATKLHLPRLRPGFVPRPRLVRALSEGRARGRVLVCAPAGFGKTALLADWAHGCGLLAAWLSLDAGDNDPARFWRHVVMALDRVWPQAAERAGPLLGPPSPLSFDGLMTALINEFAAHPPLDEVLLILDDYHLVSSELVHAPVAFLLENLPQGLHVVIASRADPPLPLPRLRARGQLTELRTADLLFTPDEAADLLAEAAGRSLPGSAVAALMTRTEGWAAGLQLAALSLRGHADVTGFVSAFSGSHRFVLDYLADEVLDRQPEQVRVFLLETSLLERLSGELCDAVTGRTGGQAMLQEIERAGLFLVPLDEVRGWWRYHHLFADLLRARLQQEQPGRVAELHRAAAAWSEEHDLADDAVRHAVAAGDTAWAAQLVERNVEMLLRRSEGATLRRWLAVLPAESVRARPRLCLAQAISAVVAGHVEVIEGLLDDAERGYSARSDEAHEPSVPRSMSVLANVPAASAFLRAELARLRGQGALAADYDRRALAALAAEDWLMCSHVRWNMAVAEWQQGRLEPAEHGLEEVLAERQAAEEGYLAMRVRYDLGLVQRARGNLDAALATFRQPLAAAGEGSGEPPHLGMAHLGLADLLYERNELAAALDHATRGVTLCRQLAFTQPLATGLALLARIWQAHGDKAAARQAMDEAGQVALSPQVVALVNPVPSQRARLLLDQGDISAASQWATAVGVRPADEPDYTQEPSYLVLARLLLARGRPGQALTLLQRLLATATGQHRGASIIEIQALRALALAAGGDQAAASRTLAEAVTAAFPQRHVRVFADEGEPMQALLAQLAAGRAVLRATDRGGYAGYLTELRRACSEAGAVPHGRRPATPPPGMAEPLTDRELEVLRLMATGMSNQRIARDLVVALDTVKKHVTHVLGKLGAANRTEAVARARQLGLIP